MPSGIISRDTTIDRIRELMIDKKLTQKGLADQIHTTQPTISKILSGKSDPSAAVLTALSEEFHVSVDWILGLSDNKELSSTSGAEKTYYQVILALADVIKRKGAKVDTRIIDHHNFNPYTENDEVSYEEIHEIVIHDQILWHLLQTLQNLLISDKTTYKTWLNNLEIDFNEPLLDWNNDKARKITNYMDDKPIDSQVLRDAMLYAADKLDMDIFPF